MDPLTAAGMMGVAALAGVAGALFGIGGGIIVVPALSLLFGLDMHEAAGISLVGIVASSTGAASRYVGTGQANIRLAAVLEPLSVVGSLAGASLSLHAGQSWLAAAFAVMLAYSAIAMLRRKEAAIEPERARGKLAGRYIDGKTGQLVEYCPVRPARGAGASLLAGATSGLLGIGGGLVLVPAMNLWMRVPIRAATATSNLMIGVTGVAGAAIFLAAGMVPLAEAAAVALGAYVGASAGPALAARVSAENIRKWFALLLIGVAALMAMRAAGVLS